MRTKVKVKQKCSYFHLILPVIMRNLQNGFLILCVESSQSTFSCRTEKFVDKVM